MSGKVSRGFASAARSAPVGRSAADLAPQPPRTPSPQTLAPSLFALALLSGRTGGTKPDQKMCIDRSQGLPKGSCKGRPSGPCQRQRSGSGTDAWQDRFAFERGRAPGGKASRSEALAPSPRHCCSRLRTDPTQRLSRASPPCRRPRSAAGAPSFVGGGDSFTGSEASPPDVERDQGRGPLRWLAMGRQLQVTLVTVTSSTFHDETVNTPALPTKCPKRTRRLALAWAEMSKDCCDHAASCTAG